MGMSFNPMYQPVTTTTIKADGDMDISPYDLLCTDVYADTVEATEFVGGVGNFSSTITNTLGVPFNPDGVKYATGNTVNYSRRGPTDWINIGTLNPPTSGYPQWLKIEPPECKVTGNVRTNMSGDVGIRIVNADGDIVFTYMHPNPADSSYTSTFECILNPYASYTVQFYCSIGGGYDGYATVNGLSIQA